MKVNFGGLLWAIITPLLVLISVGLVLFVIRPNPDLALWVFLILACSLGGWVLIAVINCVRLNAMLVGLPDLIEKGQPGLVEIAGLGGFPGGLIRVINDRPQFKPTAVTITRDHALDSLGPWQRVGLEQIPALFTGLGILFTFYGLVEGLHGFDLNRDSAAVTAQLGTLLGGISVAFHSSLVGIFLSAGSLAVTRSAIARLGRETERVRQCIEISLHHQSPEVQLRGMNARLQKMVDASEDMSAKIGTLASDMANAVADQIRQPLESLGTSFEHMAQGNTQAQADAMGKVMEVFQAEFAESLGQNFGELNQSLERTLEWHEKTQFLMSNLLNQLTEVTNNSTANLRTEEGLLAQRAGLIKQQHEQAEKAFEFSFELQKELSQLSRSLQASQEAWRNQSDQINATSIRTAEILDRLSNSVTSSEHKLTLTLEKLTASMEKTTREFASLVDQLRHELETDLNASLDQFDGATAKAIDHFNGTLAGMQTTLAELERVMKIR